MYKLEIILNEQTPLTRSISNVKEFIEKNRLFLDEFVEFAKSRGTAVGLAANQVSNNGERIMHSFFAIKNPKTSKWDLIFNPSITKYIGMREIKEEGCLTWPHKRIIAERSRAIEVSFYDEDGIFHENVFVKGFDAEIVQHEVNHLLGIPEQIESAYKTINDESWFEIPKQKEPQRNEPCPCGSGKKYKNCCLNLI